MMGDATMGDATMGDATMGGALHTRVTRMLGIRYPIVQGGLARIAGAELAAAVSQAGGIGQISTVGLDGPDELRREMRKARGLTASPFGVNLPLGRGDVSAMLEAALEEGAALIAFTAGNPAPWIRRCEGSGAKILVLTSGAELARKAEAAGADMVATVGYEGGGHLGRGEETTLVMVPRVVDAVRIPVLASGGIADGRGLLAALAMGAEGVEMGTRFVASAEARAHRAYKAALCAAEPRDTMVIKRSLGTPGRVLASPYAKHVAALEAAGAEPQELLPLVAGGVNALAAQEGRLDQGFVWAGQSVGLIDRVEPAGDIVRRVAQQAHAYLGRLRGLTARAECDEEVQG